MYGHNHSSSVSQNHKAQLANAYNELGKELSSPKIRVVGNYTLGRTIGEGTYGKVRLGIHRLTSTRVAIKQIPKEMSATLTREIHHHRRLHHPHVTQLYEVIATENYIWLVTELCSGGELFDYLVEKGRLNEVEGRIIFGQLCLAVGFIHEKGIVHRDLKLENVLLDERCRVKLGDFGFTREFEKGMLLETFCGTTGYASPEILESRKYLGPEVDIWSLGVILYTLVTGGLPFDDDDEVIMREKIIGGKYEDPEWLSEDCRDLIHNILQKDPAKRFTIAQILGHRWFTRPTDIEIPNPSDSQPEPISPQDIKSPVAAPLNLKESLSSAPSDSSFHSASSEFVTTPSTTPEKVSEEILVNHSNISEDTLKKASGYIFESRDEKVTYSAKVDRPETVVEEQVLETRNNAQQPEREPSSVNTRRLSSNSIKSTIFPTRTPVRTKRRSVSSVLSQPSSPTRELPTALPPQDFSSLLSTPAPLVFSTTLERQLLNTLSGLGFDTGQMVHSVLSDACDASGAMWWILKRKAEKKSLEEKLKKPQLDPQYSVDADTDGVIEEGRTLPHTLSEQPISSVSGEQLLKVTSTPAPPEFSFVPPTPVTTVTQRPTTPPRPKSPREVLSPSATIADSVTLKSNPSTPGGSLREKDKDSLRSKRNDGKPRSSSVSIMQRATTALEAAGLVRKRSTEAVKEEKDRKDDKEDKHTNRLTKSPPTRAVKDSVLPATPEHEFSSNLPTSPWVMPSGMPPSLSLATLKGTPEERSTPSPHLKLTGRSRTNLFSTFSKWFHDGRRKPPSPIQLGTTSLSPTANHTSPMTTRSHRGAFKKRADSRFPRRAGKRLSASSRRSSSMNSRRSSVASMQVPILDSSVFINDQMPNISRQKSDPSRRSFTPTSERGEHSSRPSSVRSMNSRNRHKKSPSASSIGSGVRNSRTASPMSKYHRRNGSSSSMRMVRQSKQTDGVSRPYHARSNSATSSIHSRQSSRPPSLYELSESEGPRTASPMLSSRSRRSFDDTPRKGNFGTVIVHRKQGIFMSPSISNYASIGRMSWKKAWGNEPPGWQSRSTQVPVEVLSISPEQSTNLRDVFTGRQSLNMGDEDDWVDEDDDIPAFVGGLGQTTSTASGTKQPTIILEQPILLSPPPKNKSNRNKRAGKFPDNNGLTASNNGRANGRNKPGHSPVLSSTILPGDNTSYETPSGSSDSRVGRRQLPSGRSGPAFRHPIQEEDEGEED